ncbi:hypothetical protein BH10ACI1_BH10ACI1_23210 [soil metagenome]
MLKIKFSELKRKKTEKINLMLMKRGVENYV